MSVDAKLAELGLTLPAASAPAANYVSTVLQDGLLHVSGQIPFDAGGALIKGRLGEDTSIEQGQEAARRCALGVVAQVQAALGGFGRVERIIKLGVFVSSTPDFTDQPKVANGASDLMVALFGDAGKHARSAVGVAVLPLGVPVEVDAIIAVR
ncbi:RidA family protein [Sandaracinobacteroides saxicola]|uniref:RidA family protein n=1 Tax=Sandaracinobacteroides saxicola TaxID=2759707 RepID=A0A7G5IG29_9SPHN|nr:RidA family protein [Sandaracinobacteroides saxicola]QMW22321.1 RidA family protein [Sandaracinobacteroides saxicola]